MVYTPTWKKNLILFCGLLENLIFTGNILGWSALNQMLKSEGIYNHFCIDEDFLATSLNKSTSFNINQDLNKNLDGLILIDARAINKNLTNLEKIKFTTENIKIIDTEILKEDLKNNETDSILNIKEEENDDYDTIKDDDENISEPSIPITTINVNSDNHNISKRELNLNNEIRTHKINSSPQVQIKRKNCKKQDTILNLAYTIGTFLNGFTAFVWGFLLDKWGLRKVRLLINSFLSIGCLLLCFTTKENPHLIFPAISLLCLGGVPLRIADMQFANLVPSLRSSIITLYSGAFSASSIIFVILKYIYEHGMNYYYTTSILFLTSLLILPITFFLLPSDRIREDDIEPNEIIKKDPQNKVAFTIENTAATNQSIEDVVKFSRQKFNKFYQNHSSKIPPITLKKFQYISSPELKRKTDKISSEPVELNAKIITNHNVESCDKVDEPLTEEIDLKTKNSELPLKLSLYSFPYLVHQYWFCWLITYMIMYVGSMNLWINRITEDVAKASFYLRIYGFLQVFSLILAPLAGAIMDYEVSIASKEKDPFLRRLKMTKAGFWPILLTNLSLVGVIICKFFDHEIAIYISIFLNTILRSFLVAVASAYLRIRFPGEHFNKLLGIMSTVGSLMTLLQFPLFIWESSPDNVIWVNIFNAFLTLISFSNPILLLINPIQEKIIKRQQKLESLYKN